MRGSRSLLVACAGLLVGALSGVAAAAPYSMLEAFRDAASRINSNTSLRYTSVAVIVSSVDASVEPEDIVMTVQGQVPKEVRVGPGGLLNWPNDPEAVRMNPKVTVNQPRGTVKMRLQPFVRVAASQAVTLDVVGRMRSEYAKVRAGSEVLEQTYRVQPTAVRLVPARGSSALKATTTCGVTFHEAVGGAVEAPLEEYPVGCYLKVVGKADRLELVFGG